MSAPAAKSAAREVRSSAAFEMVARAGYVANGIVHVLLGVIILVIAFRGYGEGDEAGALKAVAETPFGFVLLWLIAITLWALGVWRAAMGVLARDRTGDAEGRARKWGRRALEWGQALVFVALGVLAASVAVGVRPDGEETAEVASGGLLVVPGGSIVLAVVGVGIGVGGIVFGLVGIRRSFRERMSIPTGAPGRGITILGTIGYVAKGVALVIVGVLLVIASLTADAETAGGLDGAVDALLEVAFGPVLVGAVGVGFIAYGVFTMARARYARM